MRKLKLLLGLSGLCMLWVACVHEPVPPRGGNTEGISFKNEILPLLESSCAVVGCHVGLNPPKNVNLGSYNKIIETADVKAGEPENSKLYEVLVEDSPSKVMPPGSPLPASQIEIIRKWIEQGAKEN